MEIRLERLRGLVGLGISRTFWDDHSSVARMFVLVGPSPTTRGGIAQFNRELARVLGAAGAQVRMLSYRRIYPPFSRAGRQGADPSRLRDDLPSERVLVPWLPWTWVAAARTSRRSPPDVVVIQWWHPITAGSSWYLARRAARRARVVFVCHNASPHEGFPGSRLLTRTALSRGDLLLALSEGVADELKALVPDVDVRVVPHPTYRDLSPGETSDEARLERWRLRLRVAEGDPVVLFFGNVRPYKGVTDLIEAFKRVHDESGATLVIAGTFFESVDAHRRRVAELGLADAVRFVPEYIANEDVGPLITLATLLVLPYRTASQSGVIPLAAAYERPVVATRVGGLPEALAGGGILVPPADPAALAAAILQALEEPPPLVPKEENTWDRWCETLLSA